jgi:hypothetical protein
MVLVSIVDKCQKGSPQSLKRTVKYSLQVSNSITTQTPSYGVMGSDLVTTCGALVPVCYFSHCMYRVAGQHNGSPLVVSGQSVETFDK